MLYFPHHKMCLVGKLLAEAITIAFVGVPSASSTDSQLNEVVSIYGSRRWFLELVLCGINLYESDTVWVNTS